MDDEIEEEVCGHELCKCQLGEDTAYCSLYCEEADEAEVIGTPCKCGHLACIGEAP